MSGRGLTALAQVIVGSVADGPIYRLDLPILVGAATAATGPVSSKPEPPRYLLPHGRCMRPVRSRQTR